MVKGEVMDSIVTADDVIAQMRRDNEREHFPECSAAIRLVELAADHIRQQRQKPRLLSIEYGADGKERARFYQSPGLIERRAGQ